MLRNCIEHLIQAYLFVLMVLLPIDWFAPTGLTLREAGAKPAVPFMLLGALLILFVRRTSLHQIPQPIYNAALIMFAIVILGSLAFEINLILSWSHADFTKAPVTQFIFQFSLFALFAVVVIIHALLFMDATWRTWILQVLPYAALIHLGILALEWFGVLQHTGVFLSLFRDVATGDRFSGLMSEPSYFGAFAGLYGGPLLAIRNASHYRARCFLGLLLFVASLAINAKTFIPVLLCEVAVIIWHRGRHVLSLRNVGIAGILAVVCVYVIVSNAALNLQDNLSSIMRLGSNLLALNAAFHGYGLTGIGFGQFHFFYRESFAPHFLLFSEEAANQFSGNADYRASTFNLFSRLFLETGLGGILLFVAMLYRLLRSGRDDSRPHVQIGILVLAGSIGFLFTQDSYFYPPLALAIALVLGSQSDAVSRYRTVTSPMLP